MNKFNLLRLKKYGLIAEITSTQGATPHLRLNLPSGRQTGMDPPPHPFESEKFSAATAHLSDADRREFVETDESCAIAARSLLTLARHGESLAAAAKNTDVSATRRQAILVEASTTALTEIGGQFAALTVIGDRLQTQHANLYGAPVVDVSDAIIDIEVRALFRTMATPGQINSLAALGKPEFERLLLALKRSPLPLNERDAKFVDEAWVKKVCAEKPEPAATLKIAEDNHEWAVRLVELVASLIESPSVSGTAGAIDRFTAYKLLRPTGGAAVLRFSDSDVAQFERRLAQAAA